ncbi:sensor histidine kinase [Sphingosinithalassobacter portus]|uniref:sensor histidine kinase n=1 Tax=Stakelama portus TaxID=2676234 RepID=UPI001EFC3F3B|nr:histidine kinase dimerization/phosphoacceptor domain -containing protein [Sphingosinithalassobacter portus]
MGQNKPTAPGRWLERLPIARDRPALAVVAMLAICAVALAARFLADPWLPSGFPYVTFFPAVIISSFLFGVRIGGAAGVICGVLSWYFFIGEREAFTVNLGAMIALCFYILVVGTDIVIIHWLQRANGHLATEREVSRTLAKTRELLFRELQHRVSNNLQVAAGLLTVQKRRVRDEAARAALDESARRLGLIGRISRQLYDAEGATRSMAEFLEPLCADVVEASGRRNVRCSVSAAHDALLAPDAAIPLALIVAEAVANAIEHGFAGREDGTIEVELVRDGEEMLRVEVRDDGHGLPEGFDIEASDNLGLRIAAMLAQQLRGRFELVGGKGATARLMLPA